MDVSTEFFREMLADDPLLSWIDAEVVDVDRGVLTVRVPESERIQLSSGFNELGGVAHAGIVATLVDLCGGAARTEIEDGDRASLATVDLNVTYLRPATGDLLATGETVRAGSSTAVVEVAVESEADGSAREEVAVGRATYRVLYPDE